MFKAVPRPELFRFLAFWLEGYKAQQEAGLPSSSGFSITLRRTLLLRVKFGVRYEVLK